jgi:hypothetical protein
MRLPGLVMLVGLLAGCAPQNQQQALSVPPLAPQAAALKALESGPTVRVERYFYSLDFIPRQAKGGLAFYPGGRVDYRAYAPVLRRIAEAGYRVSLLEVPFSLAILDGGRAVSAIANAPDLGWVVAGHSLGGVAAANFTADNPKIKGMVLWASFPQGDLSSRSILTLSLFGERDGLISTEQRNVENRRLPKGAQIAVIAGLNHAGFGDYGAQPGDNAATIGLEQGWDEIAKRTVAFLDQTLK